MLRWEILRFTGCILFKHGQETACKPNATAITINVTTNIAGLNIASLNIAGLQRCQLNWRLLLLCPVLLLWLVLLWLLAGLCALRWLWIIGLHMFDS